MAFDLLEILSTEQPCLVKCADYERSVSKDTKDCELELMKLVESSLDKPAEDRFNLVYLVSGRLQSDQKPCMTLINQCDLDVVKSTYEDMAQSHIYGIYKGDTLSVNKLQSYRYPTLLEPRISLKSDVMRNGNARRAAQQAGIFSAKPEPSTSRADYNQAKTGSSGTTKPSAGAASFFSKKLNSSKPQESKSNTKKEKLQPKQNKLNFSNTSKTKPLQTTAEKNTAQEEKPEGISAKEDGTDKTTTSKPRQRVRLMSESSSDEEQQEKLKHRKKPSPKKKENFPESNTVKLEPKLNTTTLLDPDDVQFGSDDEVDKQMLNGCNEVEESEEKHKKKRRKRKADSDEEEETNSTSKKCKTPNYGKVKSGDTCSSMKYVDKTWLDDDGFLVTEKVLEEDTTSKPPPSPPKPNVLKETSIKQKVEKIPAAKKKSTKPITTQQSSITSFFKKK